MHKHKVTAGQQLLPARKRLCRLQAQRQGCQAVTQVPGGAARSHRHAAGRWREPVAGRISCGPQQHGRTCLPKRIPATSRCSAASL